MKILQGNTKRRPKYAFLVYQGNWARVYVVNCLNPAPYGRNAKQVYYGPVMEAIGFCLGLGACGVIVRTAAYDFGEDPINAHWSSDVGDRTVVELNGLSRKTLQEEAK